MKRAHFAFALSFALLDLWGALAPPASATEPAIDEIKVEGLAHSVRVRTDAFGVLHIFAVSDEDAMFMLGYVHARDRMFQRDLLRHQFEGAVADLLGVGALSSDVEFRTLGLRRAAEATLPALSAETRTWLESYARGVNAYLAENPLPPEYAALGLGAARPWMAIDSVTIGKGLAFGLSFDLSDIDFTVALGAFQAVGQVFGFDGTALFLEDLYRSAPFDPTISIPMALEEQRAGSPAPKTPTVSRSVLALARSYRDRAARVPSLARALRPQWDRRGSNWWIVSGRSTESGFPILANDPHLGLDSPSIFYEAQVRIDPRQGSVPMNAFGGTSPGVPGIVLGRNPWTCWGATVNPMGVTDVYLEQLVVDPGLGLPVGTRFEDAIEPIQVISQTFRANTLDPLNPGTPATIDVPATEGGVTLVVPRRNNGPIVAVEFTDPLAPTGLSIQYTGFGATRELDAFRTFNRAASLDQFREGLRHFDVGSQNFSYADVFGNIAYFTSAEMPIREGLQTLNAPDGGVPPWLIRDGSHGLRHEWLPVEHPQPGQILPYEILPFDEMPHTVNPADGFVLSANNDPIGTSLDNHPLNQLRPGGGLFYLSPGYASGFRAGRMRDLLTGALESHKVTPDDLAAIQADNTLLDSQVLVPYLADALGNANAAVALPELAALGDDPEVDEAVTRILLWDGSTPTGIPEGYDPGDPPNALPTPSQHEIDASVAGTLYSTWRGQLVQRVIDGTLGQLGLTALAPGSSIAMAALRHHLDAFPTNQGVGASGLAFFTHPSAQTPAQARDLILLGCLRDALDVLASDELAPAFGNSTDQEDYRWGKLHRIVFDHPLGSPFSIPSGGGFSNLSPELPGIAKAGGFGAVDASSHSARADGLNDFMFGSGPARRFVGELTPMGPDAIEVIPGGQSGIPGHPLFGSQLPLWLTDHYHPYPYRPNDVVDASAAYEVFVPR